MRLLTWRPTRRPGTGGTWKSRRDFEMFSRTALSTTERAAAFHHFSTAKMRVEELRFLVGSWERRREMKFPAEFVRAHQIDVADPSLASTTGPGKAAGRDHRSAIEVTACLCPVLCLFFFFFFCRTVLYRTPLRDVLRSHTRLA